MPGGCWPLGEHRPSRRTESALVGRSWELNTITAILDEAIGGAGCVVTVVGPPGIGKSRLIRESAAIAAARGVEVYHHLLRIAHATISRFTWWPGCCAERWESTISTPTRRAARLREQFPDADPEDLVLLDDLLGIRGRRRPHCPMSPPTRDAAG